MGVVKLILVADDVLEIIAVPDRLSGCLAQTIDLPGSVGFEVLDDGSKRTGSCAVWWIFSTAGKGEAAGNTYIYGRDVFPRLLRPYRIVDEPNDAMEMIWHDYPLINLH